MTPETLTDIVFFFSGFMMVFGSYINKNEKDNHPVIVDKACAIVLGSVFVIVMWYFASKGML